MTNLIVHTLGSCILTCLISSSKNTEGGKSTRTRRSRREAKKKQAKHRDDKGGISSIAAAKWHDRDRK